MEKHTVAEKQVFVLEHVVIKNSGKKLPRRTLDGKIKAITGEEPFLADGTLVIGDKMTRVKEQTMRKLRSKGVDEIKIPGVSVGFTIAKN